MRFSQGLAAWLLLAAVCSCLISCGGEAPSVPVTGWSILYRDDPAPETLKNSTEWRPIAIPSTFRLPYRPVKGLHYAWLRGQAEIPGDPSTLYGISLGRVYYTDMVYINDKLIGSKTTRDISIMSHSRNYPIPAGTLHRGTNTVYIRIGIYQNEYGGITSPVVIQDETSFSRSRLIGDLIYFHVPIVTIIVSFFVLILLTIFYLWNRSEKHFLYSSIGVIIYIFYLASLFYPYRDIDFPVIKFMHAATVQFFSITLILVIQSVYGIYITNYNRILIPALLGLSFLNFLSLVLVYRIDIPLTHYTGDLLSLITVCVNVPLAVKLAQRLNRLKPDRFKYYLSLFSSIGGGLVILVEVILSIKSGRLTFLLATYCSPLFFVVFAAFFAQELMKKNAEISHLYDRLKADEPVINETTQEKLDKVMQFIRENYTSDLSREGLAAAVNMNPNYMSTLFKKYTGYKINDYINKLRIEEAAEKLSRDDEKIIEIAFSVGFESLTTFNRVFKSIIGKTPTEYRDMA